MILEIYQKKLQTISEQFSEQLIGTSYGNTNVIILGDAQKPKLFLVHGLNSAAPFALDLLSFLTDKYQVFAIDILGQPNKSEFKRLNKKNASYGQWLIEIIDSLQLYNITFCGISFGAFPILKSLLIDNKKVKEVFLISPAGIINGNLWKTIFCFLIPMRKYQKTKNTFYLKQCLTNIYDEIDEISLQYQKVVFTNFKMDFSLTPNFKKSELKKIKVPISIIASKNDFFVPAEKLKEKCKNLSDLKSFTTLEHSKHIPYKSTLENVFNKFTS